MLCEKCGKNNAEVYYSCNINGKETELRLCRECAQKLQKSGELSFFSDGIFGGDFGGLSSMIGSMLAPMGVKRSGAPSKRCDLCGMTFDDIRREGKAGCPRCYETFADELERIVAGIHGGTKHTGRAPQNFKERKSAADRIEELRGSLKKAVAAEDYEEAARLRDKIRELEGGSEQ